jgi:hypothetical protein
MPPRWSRGTARWPTAELKLLLDAGDDESRKRIFVMLRRSAAANDLVASFYESQFGKTLEAALGKSLDRLEYERALGLRYGNPDRADAAALEEVDKKLERLGIEGMQGEAVMKPKEFKEKVESTVAEIQEILATVSAEAAAFGGSAASTQAAIAERLGHILATKVDEDDDDTVGALLAKTLGPERMRVVEGLASGDPVEAAAAQLAQSDAGDDVKVKNVRETIQGLHERAEQDVRREVKEKIVAMKASGAGPAELAAEGQQLSGWADKEIEERSKSYTDRLRMRIDQIGSTEAGHHRFAQIVDSMNDGDKIVVDDLMNEGGKLSPLQTLAFGLAEHDLASVAKLLRGMGPDARKSLVAEYDAANSMMGFTVAGQVAPKEIEYPGTDQVIHLPRSDAESEIAELIEAPNPGGDSEIAWTHKWMRDTYERAIQSGGITGELADIGGRKVREMLDDSVDMSIDAVTEYRKAETGEQKEAALQKLREARAAITGDKTAYIADTDQIRASIASAVAMVVDIALTILLPETAGLVSKLATSLIANIGSKVVVLQDQYTFEALKGDIVGSVVGLGLGSPSRLAGEEATKLVGSKIASAAEQYGFKISPELRALGGNAVKLGGEVAENVMVAGGTNEAMGQGFAGDDMASGVVTNIVKGHATSTVRGMVHGPAGGGAAVAGPDTETVPQAGPDETTRPAKTAVDEPLTVPDAAGGGGSGRGGRPPGSGGHDTEPDGTPTVRDEATPTVVDDEDAETQVKPTPMALPDDTALDKTMRPDDPRAGVAPAAPSAGAGKSPGTAGSSPAGGGSPPPGHAANDTTVPDEQTARDEQTRTEGRVNSQAPESEQATGREGTETAKVHTQGEFSPHNEEQANQPEPTVEVLQGYTEEKNPPPVGGLNAKEFLRDRNGKLWLFKPKAGEEPLKFGPEIGIEQYERWRRAKAAAELADVLGFETPNVRLVEYEGVRGSLQPWDTSLTTIREVSYTNRGAFDRFMESEQRHDMDAFDFFIANQDRHGGNWMVKMDGGEVRLVLIDQDSSIPQSSQRGYRSQEQRYDAKGQPIPRETYVRNLPLSISESLAQRFRELDAEFPAEALNQWLTGPEIEGLHNRLSVLLQKLDSGKIQVVPD